MGEKELRLALVCFGGVSLAVYMHGICTEILKLVRASAALHAITDRTARAGASYASASARTEPDSEPAYFELLKAIGRHVDLRVIVDVIAGASAGGINGTMLAQALSQDLSIDDLTDLWLEKADVQVLLADEARAGRWSKLALKPLLWGAASSGLLDSVRDAEVRKNLSLLVRSRWFRPPFDGARMTGLMLDGMTALERSSRPGATLIPSGQRLDLFVTLTDYHGRPDMLQLHDPVFVQEKEHRHVVHLRYRRGPSGVVENDFGKGNLPGLAFIARATSSFPGAFPPARICDLDALLSQRQLAWTDRQSFLDKCFAQFADGGIDPATVCFIDGGVLNNRPFKEAIAAIRGRPAYRQVDRRLIYIEPAPVSAALSSLRVVPGFMPTLKAAISDLPRAQPITDELNALQTHNKHVRGLRAIIEGARPRITGLVARVVPTPPSGALAAGQITRWRQHVNDRVRLDAGFAYDSYVQLKLRSAVASVARLITDLHGSSERSLTGKAIAWIMDVWAAQADNLAFRPIESIPTRTVGSNRVGDAASPSGGAKWVEFLLAFDTDYRKRRLHFLVEGQNRLYQFIAQGAFPGLDPAIVDRLKRQFYVQIDRIDTLSSLDRFSDESREAIAVLFNEPTMSDARDMRAFAERFVSLHRERLDCLVAALANQMGLQDTSRDLDLLLSSMDARSWHAAARYEVLINYLGFPYWDVLTLPVTANREHGEFHEILVDRISPVDAVTLSEFSGADKLKGGALGAFAAFFSRSYRENDYLLGRLHAADRLIDIVCDAAGFDRESSAVDIVAAKKRAFRAILRAENSRLQGIKDLKAALRRAVMTM